MSSVAKKRSLATPSHTVYLNLLQLEWPAVGEWVLPDTNPERMWPDPVLRELLANREPDGLTAALHRDEFFAGVAEFREVTDVGPRLIHHVETEPRPLSWEVELPTSHLFRTCAVEMRPWRLRRGELVYGLMAGRCHCNIGWHTRPEVVGQNGNH